MLGDLNKDESPIAHPPSTSPSNAPLSRSQPKNVPAKQTKRQDKRPAQEVLDLTPAVRSTSEEQDTFLTTLEQGAEVWSDAAANQAIDIVRSVSNRTVQKANALAAEEAPDVDYFRRQAESCFGDVLSGFRSSGAANENSDSAA